MNCLLDERCTRFLEPFVFAFLTPPIPIWQNHQNDTGILESPIKSQLMAVQVRTTLKLPIRLMTLFPPHSQSAVFVDLLQSTISTSLIVTSRFRHNSSKPPQLKPVLTAAFSHVPVRVVGCTYAAPFRLCAFPTV